MGTSASGSGAGSSNPLIPNWIDGGDIPPPDPLPPQIPPPGQDNAVPPSADSANEVTPPSTDSGESDNSSDDDHDATAAGNEADGLSQSSSGNRYRAPRINFNKYVRSGGRDTQALKEALKGYSKNAAGGTRRMARRMQPAASRVAGFYTIINTVREQGKNAALAQFNLSSYQNKPLFEILSSLSDEVFKDTGKIYEDTQDDSITKQAYANTIVRICELEGLDLDTLTNEQVEVMMAIFIEETIAQRVINDIGNKLTRTNTNIKELVAIEDNIYQVINGLVRTQIMPEIIATQRGDKADIEQKIENIYSIAFDAMAGTND